MATLFIVMGNARAKLNKGDKMIEINIDKYGLGDIPKLLALAKLIMSSNDKNKIDEEAYKFLGLRSDEIAKYDKIKICLDSSFSKVIKGKVKLPDIGYDIFSCE